MKVRVRVRVWDWSWRLGLGSGSGLRLDGFLKFRVAIRDVLQVLHEGPYLPHTPPCKPVPKIRIGVPVATGSDCLAHPIDDGLGRDQKRVFLSLLAQ